MTTKLSEKNISIVSNLGVNWQSVVVADGSTGLTAVSGRGYFIDTTNGTITVTLPSNNIAGNTIILKDYARSWATNNVTLASTLVDGGNNTSTFSTNGQTVTLVYMNDTKGWSLINEDTTTNLFPPTFTLATGGTVTTSGDFKIHTFTGDGCFVVSSTGNGATNPSGGPAIVDYLVVAGGGGAGFGNGGNGGGSGGGAGGFREGKSSPVPAYTASPLAASGITVATTTYPVTVGGGGVGGVSPSTGGSQGSNSVFSTITSTGGGGGGGDISSGIPATTGGSGAAENTSIPVPNTFPGQGALGNSPPVSPPQGNPGGASAGGKRGGGGGATQPGQPQALTNVEPAPASTPISGNIGSGTYGWGGKGGDGATTSISGTSTSYSGGGGGGGYESDSFPQARFGGGGAGGAGGGGGAANRPTAQSSGAESGTANRGGGGGGGNAAGAPSGGAGGKGIVIIRYKFQ